MVWGEALLGKISRLSLSEQLILVKIRMFIPFFAATQKDFALFLYLCTRQKNLEVKYNKILYGNEFKNAHNITIIRSELSTL